jgi:hypothetical protein
MPRICQNSRLSFLVALARNVDYSGFKMTNYSSKAVSTLALALEVAMRCDATAQARYEAIYGEAFAPLEMSLVDAVNAQFSLAVSIVEDDSDTVISDTVVA